MPNARCVKCGWIIQWRYKGSHLTPGVTCGQIVGGRECGGKLVQCPPVRRVRKDKKKARAKQMMLQFEATEGVVGIFCTSKGSLPIRAENQGQEAPSLTGGKEAPSL